MSANNRSYFSLPLFIVFGLISLTVEVSGQSNPAGFGMTSGRLVASASAILALIGVVIGVLALVRPAGRFGTASGPLGAIIALAAGLIGAAIGGIKAATTTGIGTGGGLAGAVVAVVLGLIAIALGALALSRSRSTA
jgi:hypothetical protein